MILPHPESDLSVNVMVLGTEIIKSLKGRDFVFVESLMNSFIKNDKKRTPEMLINTLTFLYSCGMLEKKNYRIKLIIHQQGQTELF